MRFKRLVLTLVVLSVTGAPPLLTDAMNDHSSDPDVADASCTPDQQVLLSLELGDGIPLPREYYNPTNDDVNFSARMNANRFFGPAHDLGQLRTLPAGTGVTQSEARVIPTTSSTPIGTDRVVIDISTDDGTVVARCDYLVKLERPSGMADLIQIPLRWCVIVGSSQARGLPVGALAPSDGLFDVTEQVNNEIWVPGAHIAFTPASLEATGPVTGLRVGIPIIPDPDGTTTGFEGDVHLDGLSAWPAVAAEACAAVWNEHAPDVKGIVAVNARRFTGLVNTFGVVPPVSLQFQGGEGARGDDLCGHPRQLTEDDVIPQMLLLLVDPDFNNFPVFTLAHELGHTLMLGHGNGLDDNHDGRTPPSDGPRRFDQHCDPLGFHPPENVILEEELLSPTTPCAEHASLMLRDLTCPTTYTLQPLQVEQARAVAALVPGALVGIDCTGGMVVNPECSELKDVEGG